jgi:hypothetical protein
MASRLDQLKPSGSVMILSPADVYDFSMRVKIDYSSQYASNGSSASMFWGKVVVVVVTGHIEFSS